MLTCEFRYTFFDIYFYIILLQITDQTAVNLQY